LKFEAGLVGSRERNWDGPSLTIGSKKTKTTPKMKNQDENGVLVLEKKKNN
jgi:hypothetical protein